MPLQTPTIDVNIGYTLCVDANAREYVRLNLGINGIPANGDHDETTLHIANASKAFAAALEELGVQAQKLIAEHGL